MGSFNWQGALAGLGGAMQGVGQQMQGSQRDMALMDARARLQEQLMGRRQEFDAEQGRLNREARTQGPIDLMERVMAMREDFMAAHPEAYGAVAGPPVVAPASDGIAPPSALGGGGLPPQSAWTRNDNGTYTLRQQQ